VTVFIVFFASFYRLYLSTAAGIAAYIFIFHSLALGALSALAFRLIWFTVEHSVETFKIESKYKRHIYEFKQQLGPYGIRLANMAEKNRIIKKSLAEVFTSDRKKLEKNVEQLKVMNTLFNAGMQPDSDTYLMNDCKLKYGLFRLEQLTNK
jgi:hypothetical protein